MDPQTLKSFIRLISKEKDLPPEILKDAIEHAILAASRKQLSQYRDAVVDLNVENGLLSVIVTKTVKEEAPKNHREFIGLKEARKALGTRKVEVGQDVRVPIDPAEFGRIAAQSARQMVMQRLRDAEREKTFQEYRDKTGVMVTGIVQRFERRDVIVNIGKAEGLLPANEQPQGTHYRFNDRLKVLITSIENTTKGPAIILSRKDPRLVIELFKQEVPEIADGTVQIVGIAREAGVRTKIAVRSINSDVDPVGACVGMKGSRVQMVVRELENEKIDIVPWSAETSTFIRNALNPAKIVGIDMDYDSKRADVTVAQGNLAIAIGRKGQNTKLAARLTGFRLDIRSENEDELAYEEIQRRYLEDFVSQIEGLGEFFQQAILASSFNSVDKIANAEINKLLPLVGDNIRVAQMLINGAGEYLEALRDMERIRKEEALLQGEELEPSPESILLGEDPSMEEADEMSDEEQTDDDGDDDAASGADDTERRPNRENEGESPEVVDDATGGDADLDKENQQPVDEEEGLRRPDETVGARGGESDAEDETKP